MVSRDAKAVGLLARACALAPIERRTRRVCMSSALFVNCHSCPTSLICALHAFRSPPLLSLSPCSHSGGSVAPVDGQDQLAQADLAAAAGLRLRCQRCPWSVWAHAQPSAAECRLAPLAPRRAASSQSEAAQCAADGAGKQRPRARTRGPTPATATFRHTRIGRDTAGAAERNAAVPVSAVSCGSCATVVCQLALATTALSTSPRSSAHHNYTKLHSVNIESGPSGVPRLPAPPGKLPPLAPRTNTNQRADLRTPYSL